MCVWRTLLTSNTQGKNTSLKHVDLSNNAWQDPSVAEAFRSALPANKTLVSLVLLGCHLDLVYDEVGHDAGEWAIPGKSAALSIKVEDLSRPPAWLRSM